MCMDIHTQGCADLTLEETQGNLWTTDEIRASANSPCSSSTICSAAYMDSLEMLNFLSIMHSSNMCIPLGEQQSGI